MSLASNLSLQEGRLSCRSESPDKLAFEANDEVDPEVTAAAAAAIEAEVDTAVTEDDTDPVNKKENTLAAVYLQFPMCCVWTILFYLHVYSSYLVVLYISFI